MAFPRFVQSLETRCLLSGTGNLALDEAKLALGVMTTISDAKSARTTLTTDGKAVAAQLKTLDLKGAKLGQALTSAVNQGHAKIGADVTKIVTAGLADGKAVFSDWLKLEKAESGNTSTVAKDQADLAADVKKLWNVEQPFVNKLETDIGSTETAVGNAIQAIVNANKSDSALSSAWTTFQSAVTSAQSKVSDDFSGVVTDVNAVIADI